jgi:hypothetical protein
MRALLALAALGLAFVGQPAVAQNTPPEQQAPLAEVAAPEVTHATALRDFYNATFFETGMFDTMIEIFLPQFRTSISQSPVYAQSNAQRRAALDALVERVPSMMREEIQTEIGTMAANAAPRIEGMVTAEEMAGIAELMRLPLWRERAAQIMHEVAAEKDAGAATSEDADFTTEELAQIEAMMEQPGGRAILRTGDPLMAILNQEMEAASPRMVPRLQTRLFREFCDILGRDCPRELREQLRET